MLHAPSDCPRLAPLLLPADAALPQPADGSGKEWPRVLSRDGPSGSANEQMEMFLRWRLRSAFTASSFSAPAELHLTVMLMTPPPPPPSTQGSLPCVFPQLCLSGAVPSSAERGSAVCLCAGVWRCLHGCTSASMSGYPGGGGAAALWRPSGQKPEHRPPQGVCWTHRYRCFLSCVHDCIIPTLMFNSVVPNINPTRKKW